MHGEDCTFVAENARLDDVGAMVALSIQTTWRSIGAQWASYVSHDLESPCLWGQKAQTVAWLRENESRVLRAACPFDRLVLLASECPGLGLPKAGFLVQLSMGARNVSIGCFDLHNIARYEVKLPSFSKKASQPTRIRAALAYVDLCERLGGSEEMWNTWCFHMARVDARFADAAHVSRLHRVCVRGGRQNVGH